MIPVAKLKLSDLPTEETEEFEFKSSSTPIKELGNKLAKAVSGFANAGGGYFLAGLGDKDGNADGGFEPMVGNQSLPDWLDTIIHRVEPTPQYEFSLIDDASGRGTIQSGRVVIAVQVMESHLGPHMGPENKYFIRAGRHTVSARHFIVEAIHAKRNASKPRLRHRIQVDPHTGYDLQLCVLSLTDAPAIDVEVEVRPTPPLLKTVDMPIRIPVIDRQNPFTASIALITDDRAKAWPGGTLSLVYRDLWDNKYEDIDLKIEFDPGLFFATSGSWQLIDHLESISKSLAEISACLIRSEERS